LVYFSTYPGSLIIPVPCGTMTSFGYPALIGYLTITFCPG